MESEAIKKLRRARTMLILGDGDEPFFGTVALGLDLIERKSCPTASTDGKSVKFNPDWILTLDAEETMALFEHEVYHVALKHGRLMREVIQEPGFNNSLWQRACDIPINAMLMEKGRKLPTTPSGHTPQREPQYDGMSAVRIYRLFQEEKKAKDDQPDDDPDGDPNGDGDIQIDPNGDVQIDPDFGDDNGDNGDIDTEMPTMDDLLEDTGGFGGVLPLMDEEDEDQLADQSDVEENEKDFEETIANSARVLAKQLESSIGDLPGFIQEIIESHIKPQRTYKDELVDLMEEITRDDYCWSRPNVKYDDIYLPTLYSKKLAELVVIVDSSGSVSQTELQIYAGEISGILEEFDEIEVIVIFHHTSAYHVEIYRVEDLPVSFDNIISGGTSYHDAYAEINRRDLDPKAILHFTDLDVNNWDYPKEPEFPVIWMNTTPRLANGRLRYSTPPWGRIIDLDPDI